MLIRTPVLLLTLAGLLPGAVIIDRMAVVVGNRVIKSSDIDRELRLTEFLNRDEPNLGGDAKHQAAERLIDQAIIKSEIENGAYVPPAPSDADVLLKQLRQDRFRGSDERLQAALSHYGIGEDQLRPHLLWQVTVLRFIDERFRPGVLVTDEETRSYYNQHLAELKRAYPQNNTFELLAPKIRASLEGERVNQDFVEWLERERKRTHIEYRQGAFQ
jgi:peptidyl-prolyl cis-trans isomerase SurA